MLKTLLRANILRATGSNARAALPLHQRSLYSTTPNFTTIDKAEVQKFSDKAAEWWDPSGEFSMLQLLNPPRVSYVRDQLVGADSEAAKSGKPFANIRMLDIGCGGGLLSEVCKMDLWHVEANTGLLNHDV